MVSTTSIFRRTLTVKQQVIDLGSHDDGCFSDIHLPKNHKPLKAMASPTEFESANYYIDPYGLARKRTVSLGLLNLTPLHHTVLNGLVWISL
jgi:hypothetical protein